MDELHLREGDRVSYLFASDPKIYSSAEVLEVREEGLWVRTIERANVLLSWDDVRPPF